MSAALELFKAVYPRPPAFDWVAAGIRFAALSSAEQALATVVASCLATELMQSRGRVPQAPQRFLRNRGWKRCPRARLLRRIELLLCLCEVVIEHLSQHGNAHDRNNRIAQLVMNLRPGCAEDEAQHAAVLKHLKVVTIHLSGSSLEALTEARFLLKRFLLVDRRHSQSPSVGLSAPMVAESGVALPFAPGSARSFDPARAAEVLQQARAS